MPPKNSGGSTKFPGGHKVIHRTAQTAFVRVVTPRVKWQNFKFTWEKERQGDKFYHLCLNSSTCCKANQLIEDELRSCFYFKIKENSRSINYNFVDRSVERQVAIRCSKVAFCWDLVRSPHVGRTSGTGNLARRLIFLISTEALPLIYFVSSAELLRKKTPVWMGIH